MLVQHHERLDTPPRHHVGHTVPSPQALNVVERFDGSKDPNTWLLCLTELADLHQWSDDTRLRVARIKLTETAQRWARTRQFDGWDDFQRQLDSRFGETRETAAWHLEKCWQKAGEDTKAFADRFLQDAERAGRSEDDALVFSFIQRLQPDLRVEVARQRLQSIEEIVAFCHFWTSLQGTQDRSDRATAYHSFPDAGYGPRLPLKGAAPPPRRQELRRDEGHRPGNPFRPPLREMPSRAPQAPRANPQPAVNRGPISPAGPDGSGIEDLTRRFQKLELNLHQQLQDRNRQIKTLRYALTKQQGGAAQINLLGEELEWSDSGEIDESELDQEDWPLFSCREQQILRQPLLVCRQRGWRSTLMRQALMHLLSQPTPLQPRLQRLRPGLLRTTPAACRALGSLAGIPLWCSQHPDHRSTGYCCSAPGVPGWEPAGSAVGQRQGQKNGARHLQGHQAGWFAGELCPTPSSTHLLSWPSGW